MSFMCVLCLTHSVMALVVRSVDVSMNEMHTIFCPFGRKNNTNCKTFSSFFLSRVTATATCY